MDQNCNYLNFFYQRIINELKLKNSELDKENKLLKSIVKNYPKHKC